jgi:hypothetical protein
MEVKMTDIIDDFSYRKSLLNNLNYLEAQGRLVGFLDWLEITPQTSTILTELRKQANGMLIT